VFNKDVKVPLKVRRTLSSVGTSSSNNYEILKEEACALVSKVEDITYLWSKNATNNYGLLANILGINEYNNLTNIATYAIPHEPASYDPNITNATPTHTQKRIEEE
jgi:hypothetical protein